MICCCCVGDLLNAECNAEEMTQSRKWRQAVLLTVLLTVLYYSS